MTTYAEKMAYEEKQKAYEKMKAIHAEKDDLCARMQEVYHEVGELQKQYDEEAAETTKKWDVYKELMSDYDGRIDNKTAAAREAKDLAEKFGYLIEESENEGKKELYAEIRDFLSETQIRKTAERQKLIEEKLQQQRPAENVRQKNLLKQLKAKRAEHQEMRAAYHALKEALAKSRTEHQQAKEYYEDLSENIYDIKFMKQEEEKEARRKEILGLAKVPKEFWENATVREYGETADIYYGGDVGHTHGHITVALGDDSKVTYSREPKESTVI